MVDIRATTAIAMIVWTASISAQTSPQSLPQYALLEQALMHYRKLAAEPGLTVLPPLPAWSVGAGDTYIGTQALRRLLTAVGDLPLSFNPFWQDGWAADPPPPTTTLDFAIIEALKRFQYRHSLNADGVLGPATWRALTTPLSRRMMQIEHPLQRWRELPPNPGERVVFINIPQFHLFALHAMHEHESQMLQMNVVVGQPIQRLRTPMFAADMTHLIFLPYWNVPHSIAARELLPAIRANANYLEDNHLELVTRSGTVVASTPENLAAATDGGLHLRQRPGPDNTLGRVKFVLPNPRNIYLHDTPAKHLFNRTRRAFSHGCVRIANPLALAEYALQEDPSWTRGRILKAMHGTKPLRVDLPHPIRVYMIYGTAIVRENGQVLFL